MRNEHESSNLNQFLILKLLFGDLECCLISGTSLYIIFQMCEVDAGQYQREDCVQISRSCLQGKKPLQTK